MGARLETRRAVEMRYLGQGHEISVPLPARALSARDSARLRAEYESRYEQQFGLRISDVPVEFLTWSVNVSTISRRLKTKSVSKKKNARATANGKREVFDPKAGKRRSIATFLRRELAPGMQLAGPALIVEPQTTTLVPGGWRCRVTAAGHLLLENQT